MPDHPFSSDFTRTDEPWGRALRCHDLPFTHLFATRDANVRSGSPGAPQAWDDVAASLGLTSDRIARAFQVHGRAVVVVRAGELLPDVQEADILVTNDVSRAVCVKVADCAPLLIGDPVTGVVAAAHAGWRGTAAGVAQAAVAALVRNFDVRPGNLVAAIGPCIGAPAYEVGHAVCDQFNEAGHDEAALRRWFPSVDGAPPHLDLWQANTDQLVAAGLSERHVHCARACTRSHPDWFFSHRGEGPGAGRMVAAIRAGSIPGPV